MKDAECNVMTWVGEQLFENSGGLGTSYRTLLFCR
ncbi:Uncharacterised protein [Vibrio cholerae]|nr:Uncharacterised protein [Vibrio cholerae]